MQSSEDDDARILEVAELWDTAKEELRRLRRENAEMRKIIAEHGDALAIAESSEAAARDSISMLHGEISELQLQLKNAEERRSTLETKSSALRKELEKFKLEAQQCEKSLKLAYEDNANNMEKAAALEAEVGHLKEKLKKSEENLQSSRSELRTSQNNHAKMLEKVMAFEAKVIDLESKNRTNAEELMHEREEKCSSTVARMRTEAELKRVIGWARGIERAAEGVTVAAKGEVSKLREQRAKLRGTCEEAQREILRLKDELHASAMREEQVAWKVKMMNQEFHDLQATILAADMDALTTSLKFSSSALFDDAASHPKWQQQPAEGHAFLDQSVFRQTGQHPGTSPPKPQSLLFSGMSPIHDRSYGAEKILRNYSMLNVDDLMSDA